MIKKSYFFIALVLFLSIHVNAKKAALLVGIGNYPASGGWQIISSTNDIDLLKPLLAAKGFKVNILVNAQATKMGIEAGLKKLIKSTSTGDEIFVHFSCHGQQMEDDNGDEADDGLDEAIIPYDAQRMYEKGIYEGQNHFRDDLLGKYIKVLRNKIGPKGSIFLSLDACHSGDGVRGEAEVEDGDEDLAIRGDSYIFTANPRFIRQQRSNRQKPTLKNAQLAPITVVSACQPSESNFETKDKTNKHFGSLSYLLANIIRQSPNVSFTSWGNSVKVDYKSVMKYQKPYIEGDF